MLACVNRQVDVAKHDVFATGNVDVREEQEGLV
jgi:hypothetical protein